MNEQNAYQRAVRLSLAYGVDVLLLILAVEAISHWFKPFFGFVRSASFEVWRWMMYGLGFAGFFIIKWAANVPLHLEEPESKNQSLARLQTSSMIVYALCEGVALLGFLLFLAVGSRSDFYMFLVLSLLYVGLYFPRKKEWENWLRSIKQRPSPGT